MSAERAVQLSFETTHQTENGSFFIFYANTCIFPEQGGRGYLQSDVIAKKLPLKIKGLMGFEVAQSPELWYDPIGHHSSWTMHGLRFGAYSKSAHKYSAK